MKNHILLILSAPFLLVGCGGGTTSSSSIAASQNPGNTSVAESSSVIEVSSTAEKTSELVSFSSAQESVEESSEVAPSQESSADLFDELLAEYGEFSVVPDDTVGASVTYDETKNVYTLAVCADKAAYTLKGATTARIVINDVNNLGDGNYKGVKLSLEGTAIVSVTDLSPIYYAPSEKNVQISAKKNTTNEIYSLGEGDAILSNNNIEVSGKGALVVETVAEHAFKADGNITLYGSNDITVTSGHDGFHCAKFKTTSDDLEVFAGTVTILSAVSQGIEGTTSKGKGLISLDGGSWNINNCESVFKTDAELTIKEGVTVTATGISGDPVAKGDGATGDITFQIDGTFSVNGEPFVS